MSARAFFDTNILIYTLEANDPRADVAERLLASGGAVNVQVINEFVAITRRKLRLGWPDVAKGLAAIRRLCGPPLPLTDEVQALAIKIAQAHGYGIYDAAIIAAALHAKCEVLYSEDLQDGRQFDEQITIENPFAGREHA
jgi:predicted nucleic acid-binding protein